MGAFGFHFQGENFRMRIPGTTLTDEGYPVSAKNFMGTIAANVDNKKLSDKEFRQFIRNTLPVVDYPRQEGSKY